MSRSGRSGRRRSKRQVAVLAAVLAVISIAVLAGVYFLGEWLENRSYQEQRQQMSEHFGELPTMEYAGQTYVRRPEVETVLLLGVDQHLDDDTWGFQRGGQSDFLLLLALDHQNRTIHQLQIDRDTMTDVTVLSLLGDQKSTRTLQICLSYAYGGTNEERCKNTVAAVENLLGGQRIDLYTAVKLDGIGALNRALGGITVTLPEDYTDLDPMMAKGATLTLTDAQAEHLVRARMYVGDGTNASRMLRQRVFLKAATEQLLVKLRESADFAGTLFDALEEISSYTNFNRGRLINEVNRAYHYDILPAEMFTGEYKIGRGGFMEFYADEDSIAAWVAQNLCELKK